MYISYHRNYTRAEQQLLLLLSLIIENYQLRDSSAANSPSKSKQASKQAAGSADEPQKQMAGLAPESIIISKITAAS